MDGLEEAELAAAWTRVERVLTMLGSLRDAVGRHRRVVLLAACLLAACTLSNGGGGGAMMTRPPKAQP